MSKAIVTKPYSSKYLNPIKLSENEQVQTGKRDTEWEGWIWCISQNGVGGWVPEKYLEIKDSFAIVKKDYDATELNVRVDEQLTIFYKESGWYWCEKENGTKGWLPCECVRVSEL